MLLQKTTLCYNECLTPLEPPFLVPFSPSFTVFLIRLPTRFSVSWLQGFVSLLSFFSFSLDSHILPLKHYWGQPQCSMWALWCCPIRPGLLSALSFILDAVNAAQCWAYHNKAAHITCPIPCTSFCFKRLWTWCVKAKKGLDSSRGVIKFKSLHFIDHWPS